MEPKLYWERKDVYVCYCYNNNAHVHCPCSDCEYCAVDASTEYRHWKRFTTIYSPNPISKDQNSPNFNDSDDHSSPRSYFAVGDNDDDDDPDYNYHHDKEMCEGNENYHLLFEQHDIADVNSNTTSGDEDSDGFINSERDNNEDDADPNM